MHQLSLGKIIILSDDLAEVIVDEGVEMDLKMVTNKETNMEERKNCWEYMLCGRELDGDRVAELGVCPAAINREYDGVNSGKAGGRICWLLDGTHCTGDIIEKELTCSKCPFYLWVEKQEKENFLGALEGSI